MTDAKEERQELPAVEKLSVTGNVNNEAASSSASAQSKSDIVDPQSSQSSQPQSTAADLTAQDTPQGPLRTPFAHPLPQCKPEPRPPLTAEQRTKYNTVLSTVKAWTTLPRTSAKNAPVEPLSEDEQMWLTRECLLRYLRASSWVTTTAIQRLQTTVIWRREYGVWGFTADYISEEMATGKETILGYDVHGRPCMYLDPGRQNTKKSDHQIEALVYMLERVIDMMDAGQETMALLISFKSATSGGSPSVGQGRQTLSILQGHYPERLGRACVSDLPWYITTFFKLIQPFMDPVTKSKIVFNTQLRDSHVPAQQLWKDFGGDADFEYEHDKYWPALNKMCEERRRGFKQRWTEAGMMIGEYEAYIRGGDQKPLKDVEDGVAKPQ